MSDEYEVDQETGAYITYYKGTRLLKDRCPVCGRQFDEVHEENFCAHTYHTNGEWFTKDELITE